ncbi:MAG: histidine kinase [Bacteroidia bacterium]|nr:histidine kinase [Bacteroidia bacterium]
MKSISKYFLLFVLLICSLKRSGAQMNIDSLQQVLSQTKTDHEHLYSYLKVLSKLNSDENEARIFIGDWIVKHAKESNDKEMLARTYHSLGILQLEAKNDVQGSELLVRALQIAESEKLDEASCRVLNSLGVMYYDFKQYDKAIKCYEKALNLGEKINYTKELGLVYYNLGGIYFETGYMYIDTIRKALNLCLKGLKVVQNTKDTSGIITINNGISYMYIDLGRPDSSLLVLKQNEQLIRLTNDEEKFSSHYLRVAQVYNSKKQYNLALENCRTGLFYAKKYKTPEWEYNYYTTMAEAYESMGDYKNANKYNKLYSDVHDSIITKENFRASEDIQNKYQHEKKEKEILKLNKNNEIQQLQLEKSLESKNRLTIIIVAVVIVLLLLAVFLLFLIRTMKERKKAFTALEEKNSEIQKQSVILSEQAKLISRYQSQMNPHLIFNALNSIQGYVVNDDKEKTIAQLQLFSLLMRETLNNSEKENIALEQEIDYLKTYLTFEQEKFSEKIDFIISVPENAEEILIPPMLIQPFIENAIKHAGFHENSNPQIWLNISAESELLKVKITDNGKGFDMNGGSDESKPHAVFIFHSRLNLIFEAADIEFREEYFRILSRPRISSGTEVEFYLPLVYKY